VTIWQVNPFRPIQMMPVSQSIKFILQSMIAGLAIAAVILLIWPELGTETDPGRILSKNNNGSYRFAVNKAAPAVVNVYASKVYKQRVNPLFQDPLFQQFFGRTAPVPNQRRDSNLGSGVIMSEKGHILTNAHLIRDKDEITITLNDGRQSAAEIIGIDTDTDLAVLKIDLEQLPSIEVGNSSNLQVGDVVLAIGNPYDFGQTVTQGIVSAKSRRHMGVTTFEDFIQTDADINPGNSGGALITTDGRLVGINTAIISSTGGSQGIGLATPVNQAIEVMRELIAHGRVVRGWLGIEAQMLSADLLHDIGLENGGVLVAGVLSNGPADKAGILPGDIILSVDEQQVSNPQQAIQTISDLEPGSSIEIRVLRGWKEMTVQARIAVRPAMPEHRS